ncbi:hypothetical protein AB833_11210 [Chromatiales bacterium (ex Bugula neritina AB1)]|nr:hypothetical protein AB833_11210 [Chromatiales bacterium (ex Bugula neritina AB1)]
MFQKISSAVSFFLFVFFASSVFSAQLVNINTANALVLAEGLNGIGSAKAQAIVEYREQHGDFVSADELINVSGIGPKLVERNRSVISTGEVATSGGSVVTPKIQTPASTAVSTAVPVATDAPAQTSN